MSDVKLGLLVLNSNVRQSLEMDRGKQTGSSRRSNEKGEKRPADRAAVRMGGGEKGANAAQDSRPGGGRCLQARDKHELGGLLGRNMRLTSD